MRKTIKKVPSRRPWMALSAVMMTVSILALVVLVVALAASPAPTSELSASGLAGSASGPGAGGWAAIISGGTLALSLIGTISTVRLGWRSEHRADRESKLKQAQLRMQLAEARRARSKGKKVRPRAPRRLPRAR